MRTFGIVVFGDELNCVGFHLAGVQTRSPAPADLDAEFTRALATASLVVLSRRTADALAPQTLQRALAGESPLVVVMPDITAPQVDSGMAERVRAALGIEG
jgi:vacuolar-type H+-ATPase subunit F/Vma7